MEHVLTRLRGELTAVIVFIGIVAACIYVYVYLRAGPTEVEMGEVIRFGTYADEMDNQPTVIVRAEDGRQYELIASRGSLRHCMAGDSIRLIRGTHRLARRPARMHVGGSVQRPLSTHSGHCRATGPMAFWLDDALGR